MITYCTNIHPAESWQQTFRAVRRYAPLVKAQVAPDSPWPLGLRLSGRAAAELNRPEAENFQQWCDEAGFYVTTVNGFPFGAFHRTPVKESVYLPDWRSAERLDYTRKLADLLAIWLPAGMTGSISTVPLGFSRHLTKADFPMMQKHLGAALDHLDRLAQQTGKEILLALEPEPGCLLETSRDVVAFFPRLARSQTQRARLAVCYDCCHQALQYESPAESLALLASHEIRIGHVQVSSALRLKHPDLSRLARFQEPCYLHQTVGRHAGGELLRFADLDQALSASPGPMAEWRVHFHLPVFMAATRECDSTSFFLEEILPLFPAGLQLEVETYTWEVLPAYLRTGPVTDSIAREIAWVRTARSGMSAMRWAPARPLPVAAPGSCVG